MLYNHLQPPLLRHMNPYTILFPACTGVHARTAAQAYSAAAHICSPLLFMYSADCAPAQTSAQCLLKA